MRYNDHLRCFASKKRGVLIDAVRQDGRTVTFGRTLEQTRAEPGYEDAEDMSIEEFVDWKAQQQEMVPLEWEPITKERYNEAMEVLPPIGFSSTGFLVSEACDCSARTGAPRYQGYRKEGGSFLASSRPLTFAEWDKFREDQQTREADGGN